MAKGLRSKIKRYWRTQLRNTIGKEHLEKQEAIIQENMKKSMETQAGCSLFKLKDVLGVEAKPIISEEQNNMMVVDVAPKVLKPTKANAGKRKKYDYKRNLHVQKKKGSKRHKRQVV